jgi:putative ABC transport system permease protein
MLSNYLKIALRNLRKRGGFSLINMAGLGLGIAASLVILLYAQHELTYDRFHAEADRIYQVYKERSTPTGMQVARDTWVPLLPRLTETFPAVETGTRFWTQADWVVHQNNAFEEEIAYTDSTFFDVFTFPLAQGSPDIALADPYAAVVTQEVAQRLFGDANPIGQTIEIGYDTTYTVRGVLAPIPTNSTLQFDVAIPLPGVSGFADVQDDWGSSFLSTYILLQPGAEPEALEAQMPDFIASIWDAEEAERTNFKLEALPDLQQAISNNADYAYILLGVALAILLIASINFTNLATARSMERAREIGVRKTLGAQRSQLVAQFLGESVLMGLCALGVGIGLAELALPIFNNLYGLELGIDYTSPLGWIGLLGVGVGVGLVAGAYPALFLAGFKPITAAQGSEPTRKLSGRLRSKSTSFGVRQGLVVMQFALSTVLIIGTFVVWQQIEHMKTADPQFDQEHLVTINTSLDNFADPEAAQSRVEAFEQEVRRQSSIVQTSFGSAMPGRGSNSFIFVYPGDAESDKERYRMRWTVVQPGYFETLGVPLIQGRSFEEKRAADRDAVVLNDAALRALGWTDIQNKRVRFGGDTPFDVIGVTANYHYQSLANAVEPIVHLYRTDMSRLYNYLAVRTQAGASAEGVDHMQQAWAGVMPGRELQYEFVDQRFAELYQTQERLATVASAFAGLAILVACLGLFGLAALMVAKRRKEISVRKVLGASIPRLVALLTKDFAQLVLVAFAVAAPVAYWLMDRWLQDFAYRINLGLGVFLGAGVLALLVAVVTVSTQTIRAARIDPARTLRSE